MSSYRCPKCGNAMQSFNRSGLTVEQCGGCRGVFLDYGELERIVQAESQWYQQQYAAQPMPQQPMPQQPMPPQPGYAPPPPQQQHYANPSKAFRPGRHSPSKPFSPGYSHGHKKRKSFLGELLDM